jgi:S-(hydroxymethyl)glutathione dehydrogenase/alcohol dehydrogenase
VLSSVQSGTAEVTLPQVAIAVQSRAIISTQNGNVRMRSDIPRFARLIEEGKLTADPIVTTKYALDDINEALHASDEKRDLSGVIVPSLKQTEVRSRVDAVAA